MEDFFAGQKLLLEDEGEELTDVQNKLERERRTRMALEERVRCVWGGGRVTYLRYLLLSIFCILGTSGLR